MRGHIQQALLEELEADRPVSFPRRWCRPEQLSDRIFGCDCPLYVARVRRSLAGLARSGVIAAAWRSGRGGVARVHTVSVTLGPQERAAYDQARAESDREFI